MHRFHVPAADLEGERLVLPAAESHHALKVLRIRPGEEIALHDGAGSICRAGVVECRRREVEVAIKERRRFSREAVSVRLHPSVIKGRQMEWLIRKATELGASGIAPLLAARSVVQLGSGPADGKADKWRGIAIEAMKQCGAPWLPEVRAPRPLADALADGDASELLLVAGLTGEEEPIGEALGRWIEARGGMPASVGFFVGPEGDFTREEYEMLCESGGRVVTLGSLTLRSETAALAGLAVIGNELRRLAPIVSLNPPGPEKWDWCGDG